MLQNERLDCEENIIFGGDLSCTLDPALDKKGGILTPRKAVIYCIGCLQNEIPAIKTDHSAICLELSFLDEDAPGPSYWKMNCSLLNDVDYAEAISKMIPVWVEEGRRELSGHRCVWDWLKYNIRIFWIPHSKKKSKTFKEI